MGQILQELKVKTKKEQIFQIRKICSFLTESSKFTASITNIHLTQMRIMNIRLTVYKCDHLFFLIPMACSLFGIPNDVAMQVVGVGFIVGVIQDSCETALNSSTDVLYTACACRIRKNK